MTIDAAVLDSKGQFLPGIPPAAFRVLEDNVPQKINKVDMGQAPLTVALLIEFSGKFQSLYGRTWFQTLQLSWGFASTLKPDDYMAVIAYDIKPEILLICCCNSVWLRPGYFEMWPISDHIQLTTTLRNVSKFMSPKVFECSYFLSQVSYILERGQKAGTYK